MIIKSFELVKINFNKNKLFLLYGQNQGLKNEAIENKFKKIYSSNTYLYDELEVLSNEETFFNNIFSKSFFEDKKLIIVNRVTDKINGLIEEILEKNIQDLMLVLNAGILEKKSKLRTLFEKNENTVAVPFYEDNNQTLSTIINTFFRNHKIPISQQSINLIVERCRGDRQNLNTELQKIESFIENKNMIDIDDILKITNLAENYNVSELIDSCLAKNKRKTVHILNENNYTLDDCIMLIRTFLGRSKRLLKLLDELKNNQNVDEVISSYRPAIFWKEKEVVKQQLKNWNSASIEDLIYSINDIEYLLKKNSNNSINIISDFIIQQAAISNN